MYLCGLQKLAMVDYPGKLAATVFTGGCNLRCPFCHNALLVTRLPEAEQLTEAEILDFLTRRKGLLDGVVLSGGEPLLQPDAPEFLRAVRELGFSTKLDTNGFFPGRLADILDAGLVDYVAMDIKNSPAKYPETCGVPGLDTAPVEESVRLLRRSHVSFEFRTTVVREFHTADDILSIGRWVGRGGTAGADAPQSSCSGAQGSSRYYLQNFVDSGALIGQGLHGFTPAELQGFADLARPFFDVVQVRGSD